MDVVSSFASNELEDARQSAQKPSAQGYGSDAKAHTCPGCGEKVITDANTAPSFCPYCHSSSMAAARADKERRPSRVIPFKLEKAAAVEAFQKICRNKPLLPGEFRNALKNGEITGLYVPYWLYNCDIDARMQGEAKNVSTWDDKNYRYTKTDVYQVERSASMKFENVPVDGSVRIKDAIMQALEPYNYQEMMDFSMGYLAGHFAEAPAVDAKQAEGIAQELIREGVENKVRGLVQEYSDCQIKDLSARSRNNTCQYTLLPVWVLSGSYKGRKYIFAMNGQTGKMTGKLPTSRARLIGFSGLAFAVTYILFMLGGLFL